MKLIIAIDPGKGGGYAYQFGGDRKNSSAYKMPETDGDFVETMRDMKQLAERDDLESVAVVEDVPKYCGKPVPSSTIFVMARSFGFIVGTLQALGFRVELVRPQAWQKSFALGTRGDMTTNQWKNKLKAEAQRLYPDQKITLATSDALLILEHAKRVSA